MTDAAIAKRQRELVTPEGLALPLTIASRGARAGALLLDLALVFTGMIVFLLLMVWLFEGMLDIEDIEQNPIGEVMSIVVIIILFLIRYAWFTWFELSPRGATPGKRALGIRVAAREGRLTAEAVLARNLMRDVEVFIPSVFILTGGYQAGLAGAAAFVWMAVFLLFPFFNRDALRAGDLVAGTWVVEAPKVRLPEVMSVIEDRSRTYRFGEAELSVYGEHELQVLENVLRQNRPEAMQQVAEAICRKIGWDAGAGDHREFLETFYAALRARLEGQMRFGKRKKDKWG
ncbi:MAG: RDD family protein [Croceibacterium sp.]